MEKYYAIFCTNLKLESNKPKHSNFKNFSKTRKEKKKGYVCLIGFFENRNKANKVINELGLFSSNFISSINFEDTYDIEIEKEMLSDYVLVDFFNAKKINDLIYKNWRNSSEGIKFYKDWSFLSAKY